jgi:hypothetical protein
MIFSKRANRLSFFVLDSLLSLASPVTLVSLFPLVSLGTRGALDSPCSPLIPLEYLLVFAKFVIFKE